MHKKAQNEFYKHFNKQEYGSNLIDNFESFAQSSRKAESEKFKHATSSNAADGVTNFYKGLYQNKSNHSLKDDFGYSYPFMNSPYHQFANNKHQEDYSQDIPTTKEQTVFLTKRKLKRDLLGSSIQKILDQSSISSRNIFATVRQQQDHVQGLKKWFASIAVKDRIKVLTAKNYCLTYFLRYVFAKIQKEGAGELAFQNKPSETYFPFIPNPYQDPLMGRFGGPSQQPTGGSATGEESSKGENLIMNPKKLMINYTPINDQQFYFMKQRYLEASSQTAKEKKAQEKIINTVRFIDLDMYIDTFTIDPGLLSNLDTFYQLLTQCSKSQVFSKGPTLLRFDIQIGKWYWDNPEWFSATSFHTLAEWIVAIIERMLWRSYYQYLLSRGQFQMNSKTAKGLSVNKLSASIDLNSLHIHPNGYQLTKLQNQKVISLLTGDSIAAQKFWQSTDGKTRHQLMNNAFQTVENKVLKENLEKDIYQQICTQNVHKLSFPFFYNLSTLKKRLKKQFELVKSKALNVASTGPITPSEQSHSSASSEQSLENLNQEQELKSSIKDKSKKKAVVNQTFSQAQKKSTFAKTKTQSKNDFKQVQIYQQTFNPFWKVSEFAISTLRSCGNISEFIGRQIYYHTFQKAKNAELDKLMEEEEKRSCQPSKKKNKKKKNKNKKTEEPDQQAPKVEQVVEAKVQNLKEDAKKGKKKNKSKKKETCKATQQGSKVDANIDIDLNFDKIFDYDVHDFTQKLQKRIVKQVFNYIYDTNEDQDDDYQQVQKIREATSKCQEIIFQPKSLLQTDKIQCNEFQEEKINCLKEKKNCLEEKNGKSEQQEQIKCEIDQSYGQQQFIEQLEEKQLLTTSTKVLQDIPITNSQYKSNLEDSEDQQEQQIHDKIIKSIPELQDIPITWTDDEDQADDEDQIYDEDQAYDEHRDYQDSEVHQFGSKASIPNSCNRQKSQSSQKSDRSLTSTKNIKQSSKFSQAQQRQTVTQIQTKKQEKNSRKRKHNNKKKSNPCNSVLNKIQAKNTKAKPSKKQGQSEKNVQTLPAGSIPSTLNSYGTIQGAGAPNIVAANQITFSEKVKKGLIKKQEKKQKSSTKNSKAKQSKYDQFPKNYYPDMVQNPYLDPFMMNMQFQQFFNAAANAIFEQQHSQQQQQQHNINQVNRIYPQSIQSQMFMQQRSHQRQQNQAFNSTIENYLQSSTYYSQYSQNQEASPQLALNKSECRYSNFQQNANMSSSDMNIRASSQGSEPNPNYSSSSLTNIQSFKRKSVNSTNSCSTSRATTPQSQSSLQFLSTNNLSRPEYNFTNVNLQPQTAIQNSPIRPQRQNNLLDSKKALPGSFLKAEVPPFEFSKSNFNHQVNKIYASQIQEIKSQPSKNNSKLWSSSQFPSLNQQTLMRREQSLQNYIYSDQEQLPFTDYQKLLNKSFDGYQDDQQQEQPVCDADQHFKYQNAQDLSYDDPSYYSIYPNAQQIMQATATSYFQTVLSQQLLQQQHSQCNSAFHSSPQSCMAHMKRFTIQKEQKLYISLSSQIQNLIKQIDTNVLQLQPLRQASIRRIEKSIKSRIFGEKARLLKIEVFGSHRNQLALQTSDIDIAICGLQNTHDWRSLVQTMEELAQTFRIQNYIKNVRVIDTATVPIIKLQVDLQILSREENIGCGGKNKVFDFEGIYKSYISGLNIQQADGAAAQIKKFKVLKIDISFDESFSGQNNMKKKSLQCTSHNGLQSTSYVLKVLQYDHRIRMIVIILKKILYLNELNEAYHGMHKKLQDNQQLGGFSSYVLVLLVQAYFRQFYISHTNYTPGKILMDFLDFIGNRFDNYNCTVQSNLNPPIIKATSMMMETTTEQKSTVRIIDPLTGANAAKGAYKIMDIRCLFSMIHCKLMHSGIEPAKRPLSVVLKTRLKDVSNAILQF